MSYYEKKNIPRGKKSFRINSMFEHPLYHCWYDMIRRCYNPKAANYKNYGGRGIKVDSEWRDFWMFEFHMGEKPTPKYTLERINNDGDYNKDNCKWATWKEQAKNKRKAKARTKKKLDN